MCYLPVCLAGAVVMHLPPNTTTQVPVQTLACVIVIWSAGWTGQGFLGHIPVSLSL